LSPIYIAILDVDLAGYPEIIPYVKFQHFHGGIHFTTYWCDIRSAVSSIYIGPVRLVGRQSVQTCYGLIVCLNTTTNVINCVKLA